MRRKPGISRTRSAAAPRRWSPFTLLCAVGPICLFGLMYLIYLFVLGNIGKNLIGTVP